jgi:hypothetical protein
MRLAPAQKFREGRPMINDDHHLRKRFGSRRNDPNDELNRAIAATYISLGWLAFVGIAIVGAIMVAWFGPWK